MPSRARARIRGRRQYIAQSESTQNESANMGVTPNKGGTTPRYNPVEPSLANVFFTTSTPPVYVPGGAVCNLVLVKSNGWPRKTEPRANVHRVYFRHARTATPQHIESTNQPRPRIHPHIPQRRKILHSPPRPMTPRWAPLSSSWLRLPARTGRRSAF
jgi:hypothetical protein